MTLSPNQSHNPFLTPLSVMVQCCIALGIAAGLTRSRVIGLAWLVLCLTIAGYVGLMVYRCWGEKTIFLPPVTKDGSKSADDEADKGRRTEEC